MSTIVNAALDQNHPVVAVHGSWDRQPPRSPAVLWMAWGAAKHMLEPAVTLITGFHNADGSRWAGLRTRRPDPTALCTSATTPPVPSTA